MIRRIHFLLFALWSAVVAGQDRPEYSIYLIDTSLIHDALAVVRSDVTTFTIHSPKEYSILSRKVVTILDKDSPQTAFNVPYDKYSKASIKEAALYDASGRLIRKIKNSEFIDRATHDGFSIFSDSRTLGFQSYSGQLPYTLTYTWQLDFNNTMSYPDWLAQEYGESVEKSTLVIDAPEKLVIHIKTLNYEFIDTTQTFSGRKIKAWTLKNKKCIMPEVSGPPYHEILPMILVAPSIFQVEEYTGSMTDWKSFGAFQYALNKGREKMTPAMASSILQMTAHCKTSFEKIDTLYHWLQQNMRYVSVQLGVGGWQSFDAATVDKNRYGDCKALSTFMRGMLQEAGIESWEVSIKWDEDDNMFFDDFANHDFNHRMLHIPQENIWLECTDRYMPTGFIDRDEENKKVLLITPEGGKIATTPSTPSALNQINTIDTVLLDATWIISGNKKYQGNRQRGIRSLYYNTSTEEQRNDFLEHFPLSVQKLDQFKIYIDKTGAESNYNYKASLNQFGTISGPRFFIPVNAIHPTRNSCSTNTLRKTDFISKDDYTETNDIYIVLPGDVTIEYLPAKTILDFNGNQYSIELNVEDQFIHVHVQRIEVPMRLKPDQYKGLCSYYNSIAKANGQMIVLKKSKA